MSKRHSTALAAASKPATLLQPPTTGGKPSKPYADFPLTAHPAGYWCKKIRGRLHYFGPWRDPDAALRSYLEQKDALHAGRPQPGSLSVKDLVNVFLNAKQALVNSNELSPLTWGDYKTACDEIVAAFGKHRQVSEIGTDSFAALRNRMAEKWGPQRLAKNMQFIRCVFKYAYDAALIDRPMRFGPGFKRPSRKTFRLHRAEGGPKLFSAEEIRRMIDAAGVHLKAMIMLGINAAFGNSDCGNLPTSALDLERGWADFPRPKTGISRRCPLWPETVQAIKESLACRPEPKKSEYDGLVFLTRAGDSWHTDTTDGPLSRETGKLLKKLGVNGRNRLGFYSLRHSHRTIADEAKDQPACDYIMGHSRDDMASVYRERISDERLKAVTDHVRRWLFETLK